MWQDDQAFASRDLGGYDIAYLFVDGIAERIRPGQRREPVLAAWGKTHDGRKVLLHMMSGSKEDPCPPSSRTCGAAALAIRCWWSEMALRGSSRRSRPAFHAPHATVPPHLAAKVSREDAWPEFREQVRARRRHCPRPGGRPGPDMGDPTAVTCFQDDFEACIAHLRMPVKHARRSVPPGAPVRGGAPAPEGDPQRLGREGGPQADVRGP